MKYYFNPAHFLTDLTARIGVLLTLGFFAVFPIHVIAAGSPFAHNFISDTVQYNSDTTAQNLNLDQNQNLDNAKNSMLDYAKSQLPHLLPGLPDEVRHSANWALGGFKDAGSFFNFNLGIDLNARENVDEVMSLLRPVTNLMHPADEAAGDASWLAPGYHHYHGVLPLRDAMLFGGHSRQDMFDKYARLDIHPYVAQNYFSSKNYYGADITLNLASPNDTSTTSKPWGKIVLSYANGDDRIMEHGRGMELHGELRFNDHLTLNSGMRQSDTSSSDNFVLLQWKMPLH